MKDVWRRLREVLAVRGWFSILPGVAVTRICNTGQDDEPYTHSTPVSALSLGTGLHEVSPLRTAGTRAQETSITPNDLAQGERGVGGMENNSPRCNLLLA